MKTTKSVLLYTLCVYIATSLLVLLINIISINADTKAATPLTTILFVLCNLMPMVCAYVFGKHEGRTSGAIDFFKQIFLTKENPIVFLMAAIFLFCYFGVSYLLKNTVSKATFFQCLLYFPQAIFLGGFEEVGWRWYLQPTIIRKDKIPSVLMGFVIISVIWAGWHFPVYQVPWVQQASTNWLIFYLMILGNTFTLGALKLECKGVWICIIYHALLDSISGILLVQSKLYPIIYMVAIECIVSSIFIVRKLSYNKT